MKFQISDELTFWKLSAPRSAHQNNSHPKRLKYLFPSIAAFNHHLFTSFRSNIDQSSNWTKNLSIVFDHQVFVRFTCLISERWFPSHRPATCQTFGKSFAMVRAHVPNTIARVNDLKIKTWLSREKLSQFVISNWLFMGTSATKKMTLAGMKNRGWNASSDNYTFD